MGAGIITPLKPKPLPFRRLITDVLHRVDEEVLIPANVGAALSLKEAQRLMAPDALGFSSFDAGTADETVLNDPDKPCCTVLGGQWTFMVNVVLLEEAAKQIGAGRVSIEPQKAFIGRNLGTNVMSLMDVLASHPNVPEGEPWKVDQLLLNTMAVLNAGEYTSPYERTLDYPIDPGTPEDTRRELQRLLAGLDRHGVADTVAYVTEHEIMSVADQLETFGYDRRTIHAALIAPPQPVDYFHFHPGRRITTRRTRACPLQPHPQPAPLSWPPRPSCHSRRPSVIRAAHLSFPHPTCHSRSIKRESILSVSPPPILCPEALS